MNGSDSLLSFPWKLSIKSSAVATCSECSRGSSGIIAQSIFGGTQVLLLNNITLGPSNCPQSNDLQASFARLLLQGKEIFALFSVPAVPQEPVPSVLLPGCCCQRWAAAAGRSRGAPAAAAPACAQLPLCSAPRKK